jgi:hypothetical protein
MDHFPFSYQTSKIMYKNALLPVPLIFVMIGLMSFISACDFSTHEYYSYESHNENEEEGLYMGWHFGDRCFVSVPVDIEDCDNITIMFPSDKIPLFSTREKNYEYVYGDSSEVIDSTMWWLYIFDVDIDDKRILANDSVYVSVNKGNKSLKEKHYFLKQEKLLLKIGCHYLECINKA